MAHNKGSRPSFYDVIQTGSDTVSVAKYGVTNEAVLLLAANDTRRSFWLTNEGATNLYIYYNDTVTPGATGINYTSVAAESNTGRVPDYSGEVWGIAGGASIAPLWISVADIG